MYSTFVLIARFGISAAFVTIYIVTSDYFPDAVTGTVFGFCNLFARIFTIFAPSIAEIKEPWPMLFFCLAATGALVSVFFLRDINKGDNK